MAGILVVVGDGDFARAVFERESRGYWSAGITVWLEKYGLLGFDVADHSALADSTTYREYDVVLVGRGPEDAWTEQACELARGGRAGVIIEGPLPRVVQQALGIAAQDEASHEGIISTVDVGLHARASEYGYPPSARILRPTASPVTRREDLDWPSVEAVPLTPLQAEAWRARGWDASRLTIEAEDTIPLAEWLIGEPATDRYPAVVQRGGIVGISFSAFAFVAQRHTSEPFDGAEHRSASRCTGLETLLLALVDRMHAHAGAIRSRILPWRAGCRWVRNIRHDFDRALSRESVEELLARHAQAGSRGTWYWRARHADGGALAAVAADEQHEVALHTELLWISADEERARVEQHIGREVAGTSAHGDPDCFRYQGAPNVLWAEEQKLEYTELVEQAHYHPHRCVLLESDGLIKLSEVICLPHHESLDRSTTPGDTYADKLREMTPYWIATRGLMQVMNHPDQNRDELFELLADHPADGRVDMTALDAVRWWRSTHVRSELEIGRGVRGPTITSRSALDALVVELLHPTGELEERVVSTEPGVAAEVLAAPLLAGFELPAPEPPANDWSGASRAFGAAVRKYMATQGREAGDPAVESTVETNTNLVPRRGEDLLALVRDLAGLESIAGLRVVDAGSGWGSLATYLALEARPGQLIGVDVRPDFVAAARQATASMQLPNLRFLEGDMADLDAIEDDSADLVLVNNAFIYLPTKDQQASALSAIRRVLTPGGRVVMFHANRWARREPFSDAPIVHWLGPRLGSGVGRITGWEHNHGRVRYLSPPAMRRALRRAGFVEVDVGALRNGHVTRGASSNFERFYGAAGRKPASS